MTHHNISLRNICDLVINSYNLQMLCILQYSNSFIESKISNLINNSGFKILACWGRQAINSVQRYAKTPNQLLYTVIKSWKNDAGPAILLHDFSEHQLIMWPTHSPLSCCNGLPWPHWGLVSVNASANLRFVKNDMHAIKHRGKLR